jgi:hypothetical protein
MDRSQRKSGVTRRVTDRLDDELVYFYAESLKGIRKRIREGQVVTYVVKRDANGKCYATDIRLEGDEPQG